MNDILKRLDMLFEKFLVKGAPSLSKKTKVGIVSVLPWLVLILALLAVPGVLAVMGIGAIATPFLLFAGRSASSFWFMWVMGLVQLVLEVSAIPGLFAKKMRAWMLLYYSNLIGLAVGIINTSLVAIALTLLVMYVLYQVKKEYKK